MHFSLEHHARACDIPFKCPNKVNLKSSHSFYDLIDESLGVMLSNTHTCRGVHQQCMMVANIHKI